MAIARALACGEPALILADEPTGNLDTSSGKDIMSLFESWPPGPHAGADHRDNAIANRTRRIVRGIQDGRIIEDDRPTVA
ncbi:MAG: hypothetical protein R2862_04655 [Thermoanaerobaculia bacterium]